ncbi:LytR family transcriptional regulator [Candidatus Borreliella tachyglossi]|uniref:LytR family transcriptional regulator n=1 Tax=Candidatus Borreliella tachyglossi TaxID=1964448 RepID=A0A2S1LXX7_9SPIR|nr:LCP family protein [Candidatus Borreliella tachyglossi]AWG43131.1 LytR family transcriptional regulator [Candidatus Borreliella tachyglossi]
MKKELVFLVLIILIVIGVVIFFVDSSKKEQVYFELNTKSNISFLFLIEDDIGNLVSMQEIFINIKTGNIGFLDIPIYTGYEDLKGNVSWFEDLYANNNFNGFLSKISRQLNHEPDYYIRFKKNNFVKFIDYLGGVRLLVKDPVKVYSIENPILIPSGNSIFDGDKAYDYLNYFRDIRYFNERFEFFKEFFRKTLAQFSSFDEGYEYFFKMYSMLDTSLSETVFRYIFTNYKINNENIIFINIKGQEEIFKDNENSLIKVIFPYYGGAVLKETIENLNRDLVSEKSRDEEIVKVVILNGTKTSGLARNASAIFDSLKFKVVKFANADRDNYLHTLVINNSDNLEMAMKAGDVIRVRDIKPISEVSIDTSGLYGSDVSPDVIIILGDDFDGRYVKHR